MKSFTSILLLALSATTLAAPATNVNAIDQQRSFSCESRVQSYCMAKNIKSGCTFGGQFVSSAKDTCSSCHC